MSATVVCSKRNPDIVENVSLLDVKGDIVLLVLLDWSVLTQVVKADDVKDRKCTVSTITCSLLSTMNSTCTFTGLLRKPVAPPTKDPREPCFARCFGENSERGITSITVPVFSVDHGITIFRVPRTSIATTDAR